MRTKLCVFWVAVTWAASIGAAASGDGQPLPSDLQAVLDKPLYTSGSWALRVVDLDTGEVIYDLESDRKMLTGSVRKLFSGAAGDTRRPRPSTTSAR